MLCAYRPISRAQGESELTHDDRKRKRKKIKESYKKQQQFVANRKKQREALNPALKKQVSEKEALAGIKKNKARFFLARSCHLLRSHCEQNVVMAKTTSSSKDTKSTAFFTKLQEQAQSGAIKPSAPSRKDRFAAQASFLKL